MSVRLRLALLVAGASIALVTLGGVVLATSLSGGIRGALERSLRHRVDRVAAAVAAGALRPVLGGEQAVPGPDQSVVQLLSLDGRVVFATALAGMAPLVPPARLPHLGGPSLFSQGDRRGWANPRLLLARAVRTRFGTLIVVVGTSLDQLADSSTRVRWLLLLGGPLAVLLATGGAYWLAGAALAPVERLRRQADDLSVQAPMSELQVPATKDELATLARTLNQFLGRIQSSVEAQRQFVAAASHQLRTPLAALQAELELAGRPGRSSAQMRAYHRHAALRVHDLIRLTSALLLLARSDEGMLAPGTTPRAVEPVVLECLAAYQHATQAAGVVLVLDAAPGVQAVIDGVGLRLVLDNLVDNALRAAPFGSPLEIGICAGDEYATITVADRGGGFPPDFLPRAFDRFQRATPAPGTPSGGAGLGLALVRSVVEAHGGHAWATNRPGGGAVVGVRFPNTAPTPTAAAAEATATVRLRLWLRPG